jgi:hypothetical protein
MFSEIRLKKCVQNSVLNFKFALSRRIYYYLHLNFLTMAKFLNFYNIISANSFLIMVTLNYQYNAILTSVVCLSFITLN